MNPLAGLSSALENLVAQVTPAVVAIQSGKGQGSGTLLTPDGFILTNHHVVADKGELRVSLEGGETFKAWKVGTDPRTDLAVIRVDGSHLPILPLSSAERVRVGQLVVAVGNPLRLDRSVSLGVVSALDRSLPVPRQGLLEGLIQTDAAINPGNSGGPLVDAEGSVVGINTAVIPWAQGIGFAVHAATATWVATVLIQKGKVDRPYLGIAARGQPLENRALLGQNRGVRVLEVNPQTPASDADLRPGDLLLAANGAPLGSVNDLQRVMVLSGAPCVEIEFWRQTERRRVTLKPRIAA